MSQYSDIYHYIKNNNKVKIINILCVQWPVSNQLAMVFTIVLFNLLIKTKITLCFLRWDRHLALKSVQSLFKFIHQSDAEDSAFKWINQWGRQALDSGCSQKLLMIFSLTKNITAINAGHREAGGSHIFILIFSQRSALKAHLKIHILCSSFSDQSKVLGEN